MSKKLHKRNIRIKKGVPPPPVSVTDGYKDYSKVLGTYTTVIREIHQKPFYKKPGLFLGFLLIIVMAVLVFLSVEEAKIKEDGIPGKPNQELEDSTHIRKDTTESPISTKTGIQK